MNSKDLENSFAKLADADWNEIDLESHQFLQENPQLVEAFKWTFRVGFVAGMKAENQSKFLDSFVTKKEEVTH